MSVKEFIDAFDGVISEGVPQGGPRGPFSSLQEWLDHMPYKAVVVRPGGASVLLFAMRAPQPFDEVMAVLMEPITLTPEQARRLASQLLAEADRAEDATPSPQTGPGAP